MLWLTSFSAHHLDVRAPGVHNRRARITRMSFSHRHPHGFHIGPGRERRRGARGDERGGRRGHPRGTDLQRGTSRPRGSTRSTTSSGRRATRSSRTSRRAASPSSSATWSSPSRGRRTRPTSSPRSTSGARSARPQRESSVRQLTGRVVDTIPVWGETNGYFAHRHDAQVFAEELTHLIVTQKAAFNSPVWFNVGVPDTPQQCSACFILAVDDHMSLHPQLVRRGRHDLQGRLRLGHQPVADPLVEGVARRRRHRVGSRLASCAAPTRRAGTIKSGGKTRRAAKMVILNVDHPDVRDFIWCKANEEHKARALRDAGFDMDLDGRDSVLDPVSEREQLRAGHRRVHARVRAGPGLEAEGRHDAARRSRRSAPAS